VGLKKVLVVTSE
jgi:hypothetical protein